ncbi:YopX family protein [Campylobacter lari]|uniref:YopX family protein n=1 Tax=Campylobacter lari TaxID=201 RepID=UPI00128406AF|nr:YopX family protein [Campylobacter lari]EAI4828634.1 hypothetical protein [Campylobacter lari]EAK0440171.1 hypothetical protein [Campylobacter lari]EAK0793920.1 hypothetical protein [Campylobacter lari]EAK0795856.1 hypothetical protein [Campylobacter lari]EAK5585244.1 hypothetical protein [Campylobacter lari]
MKLKDFGFRIWDENHKGCSSKDCKCQSKYTLGEHAKNMLSEFIGKDVEIELWTRIIDRNGKKVYENDIVRMKSPYDCFIAKISIHKEGTFYLEGKNGDYMGSLIYLVEDEAYTIEIIGNIHENKNLLKRIEE